MKVEVRIVAYVCDDCGAYKQTPYADGALPAGWSRELEVRTWPGLQPSIRPTTIHRCRPCAKRHAAEKLEPKRDHI